MKVDINHAEKERIALKKLFRCVLVVLLGKQWHLVMVVQKVTVLGVSLNIR